jgi:hypothetical protein
VVERFLFDRVDAESTRTPVRGEHDLVGAPRPYEAQAALAIEQTAGPRAEVALKLTVFEPMPIAPGYLRSDFRKVSHAPETLHLEDAMSRERVKLLGFATATGGQAVKPR